MAFVFYPSIEEVEDGMVAALKADATIAAYAQKVGSFKGDMKTALSQAVRFAPTILVIWAQSEIEDRGMQELGAVAEFHVLCVSRNLRNEASRRQPEASGEVGLYQMMADVLRVLTRSDLDLTGLEELNPIRAEVLQADAAAGGGVALGQVGFMAELELREDESDEGIADLEDVYVTLEVANPDEDNDGEIAWVEVVDPATDVTEVVQDLET